MKKQLEFEENDYYQNKAVKIDATEEDSETDSDNINTARMNKVYTIDESYKNSVYHNLPENCREAIDKAQQKYQKSGKTQFYHTLKDLNTNIQKYQSIFNSKLPTHHQIFLERKAKEDELKQ